ncbi:alanine racemase [Streptococcus equi]|uniref:alanine racemase n=1 Tax=Streptococcus equi TaxID=1336 RepID=UPI0039C5BCE8
MARACQKESVDFSQLHVHVKVDSGMGRIGVRSLVEANQLISALSDMGVQLDGIFTHFAPQMSLTIPCLISS